MLALKKKCSSLAIKLERRDEKDAYVIMDVDVNINDRIHHDVDVFYFVFTGIDL